METFSQLKAASEDFLILNRACGGSNAEKIEVLHANN